MFQDKIELAQLFQPLSNIELHKDNAKASIPLISRRLSSMIQYSLRKGDRTGRELDEYCELLIRSLFGIFNRVETTCQGIVFCSSTVITYFSIFSASIKHHEMFYNVVRSLSHLAASDGLARISTDQIQVGFSKLYDCFCLTQDVNVGNPADLCLRMMNDVRCSAANHDPSSPGDFNFGNGMYFLVTLG